MKYRKLFLYVVIFCYCLPIVAQESSVNNNDFNKWSIEGGVGQNKPIYPFATGYFSSDPSKTINLTTLNHFDIGIRYMFSNFIGCKLDYSFDKFENNNGTNSISFDTNQNRIGLQGVVNLGSIIHLEKFSNRIGILAHTGIHVSNFHVNEGSNKGISEYTAGIIFGVTPQVKITKWLAITADFSVINNVRQHLNWDGNIASADQNLSGKLYNTSIGMTFYLGNKEKHADWFTTNDAIANVKATDLEARTRINNIETLMNDTDRDGVLDFLDAENNTPNGVSVDTKGRYIDSNKNDIPDELESDNGKASSLTQINKVLAAENDLVENGLINIFFDSNSSIPNMGSTNNLFIILHYMQSNPDVKLKIVGFADKSGKESLNKGLSLQRAKSVFDFLVTNNVASNRLSLQGDGIDTNFSSESNVKLDLSRRVSVIVDKTN